MSNLLHALIAEPNPDDRVLLEAALQPVDGVRVTCFSESDSALEYLRREGRFQDTKRYPAASLVISAVNLPPHEDSCRLTRISVCFEQSAPSHGSFFFR